MLEKLPNQTNNKNEKPIEPLKYPTRGEAFRMRTWKKMKRMIAAYGIAASLGIMGGKSAQDMSRKLTNFDKDARKEYQDLKEEAAKEKKTANLANEQQKNSLHSWFEKFKQTTKEITSHKMYDEVLLKYYEVLNFIDDASFLVPAIFIFTILGMYLSKLLKGLDKGDPVQKEKNRRTLNKINEIINKLNNLDKEKDKEEIKQTLLENKDLLKV